MIYFLASCPSIFGGFQPCGFIQGTLKKYKKNEFTICFKQFALSSYKNGIRHVWCCQKKKSKIQFAFQKTKYQNLIFKEFQDLMPHTNLIHMVLPRFGNCSSFLFLNGGPTQHWFQNDMGESCIVKLKELGQPNCTSATRRPDCSNPCWFTKQLSEFLVS